MTRGRSTSCSSMICAQSVSSVMSGIITGPHFRKYFDYPGPLDVGTMVAILEVGAFGTPILAHLIEFTDTQNSNVPCCRSSRRCHRPQAHSLLWGCCIYTRRCRSDLYNRVLVHDYWQANKWFRCWSPFVRVICSSGEPFLNVAYRTIVPIYQSEISPPNHVSLVNLVAVTSCSFFYKRGALACMEFTGNIIGYSSSVVGLYQDFIVVIIGEADIPQSGQTTFALS